MSGSTSDLLVISLFPIVFIGLWLAIAAIAPRLTGWTRLEEALPDNSEASLRTLRFQGFYLGKGKTGLSYRGCVTFEVCQGGLRVRIWKIFAPFSAPIFIPWEKMQLEEGRIMGIAATRMKIGPEHEYWMTIAYGTARNIAKASGGAFVPPGKE